MSYTSHLRRTVYFLTDYGLADEFVGVVHSVIRALAPEVRVIDLSHQVAAFDVRAGALALWRAAPWLASGVVLAVVDPGVATKRRPVALEVDGRPDLALVGPDNGLLTTAAAALSPVTRAVELRNPAYQLAREDAGPTFAGRDVFAPAAAYLCRGVALAELGPSVDPADLVGSLWPWPRTAAGGIDADVLWVDRFGNVQLNVDPATGDPLGPALRVRTATGATHVAIRVGAYAELAGGLLGCLVDSYGLLALCCDQASAARRLGLGPGDPVHLSAAA